MFALLVIRSGPLAFAGAVERFRASATMQAGVQRILRDRLAWVTEVRDGVDESADLAESASLGQGAYVPRW